MSPSASPSAGGDDEEASGLVVDGVRRGSVLADDDAVGAAVGVARADVIDQVQVLAAPSPNVSSVLWVQVQRSLLLCPADCDSPLSRVHRSLCR